MSGLSLETSGGEDKGGPLIQDPPTACRSCPSLPPHREGKTPPEKLWKNQAMEPEKVGKIQKDKNSQGNMTERGLREGERGEWGRRRSSILQLERIVRRKTFAAGLQRARIPLLCSLCQSTALITWSSFTDEENGTRRASNNLSNVTLWGCERGYLRTNFLKLGKLT